jgi:hypothetical protein
MDRQELDTRQDSKSPVDSESSYELVSVEDIQAELPESLSDTEAESESTISFLEAMNHLYTMYRTMDNLKQLLHQTPENTPARILVMCAICTQYWLQSKKSACHSEETKSLETAMITLWNKFIED